MARRLPRTDLCVSPLCYGLGAFGAAVRGDDALRLYDTFRGAGGNFFDTAHCYAFWLPGGPGQSERMLGECLRRRNDRSNVVLATKGGHPDGGPRYRRPDRYLSADVLASDLTDSLERLGVDRVDLFWLHRDDRRVPVGEIIDALNTEAGAGRIRSYGASNWTVERLAEANAYAARNGKPGFVALQSRWSLAAPNAPAALSDGDARDVAEADLTWLKTQSLALIPYSPTACGYFATGGKAGAGAFENPVSRARLLRAEALAARIGCTPNQVALAWLLCHGVPVVPIVGATNVEHLRDALGAAHLELTPEQVGWLQGAAPGSP